MKLVTAILVFILAFPISVIGISFAGTNPEPLILVAETGKQATGTVTFQTQPDVVPMVFRDHQADQDNPETVWNSPLEPDKPLDIDDVLFTHDSQYVKVRITLGQSLSQIKDDIFISITMDTDRDPKTGMPKSFSSSYNMGGEDFMARYVRAYGENKFILDRWDSGRGDTVETGGLANGSAIDKEIKFWIPRRAIGDPSILDFKVVGRLYQATDPDLSPDHLKYNFVCTTMAKDATVVADKNTCKVTIAPKDVVGFSRFHLVWGDISTSIGVYNITSFSPTPPWNLLYKALPKLYKRMNIARVQMRQDSEKAHFMIDFWDGLSGMGNYDYKIWLLANTDGTSSGGFVDERFCDGSQDYIMEVLTESGRVSSKLYDAKTGMGYNKPPLTDLNLDKTTGQLSFSCKLSRIGNPKKMVFKVASGGWKAVDADWDITPKIEVDLEETGKQLYTRVADDPADTSSPIDLTSIDCGHTDKSLLFKIGFGTDFTKLSGETTILIFMDTDLDSGTGLPPSQKNPGGEDFSIEIAWSGQNFFSVVRKTGLFGGWAEVGELESIEFNENYLYLSLGLEMLDKPKGIRFYIIATYAAETIRQDQTEWGLIYSITGEEIPGSCQVKVKLQAVAGDGQVTLLWTDPETTVLGFYVFRGLENSDLIQVNKDALPPEAREFVDTGLENGKNYQHTIKVVCKNGFLGPSSDLVISTPRSKQKPQPKIYVTPQSIDIGEVEETKGLKSTISFFNAGLGEYEFNVSSSASWIGFTPTTFKIGQAQKAVLTITILENLQPGDYKGFIHVENQDFDVDIGIAVKVKPRTISDKKYVIALIAQPEAFGMRLSWQPPLYNVESLLRYVIARTEVYKGKKVEGEKVFVIKPDETVFLDKNLDPASTYTYTVTPEWPSGSGITVMVEGRPVVPPAFILLKIGSKTAVLNGTEVKLDEAPFIYKNKTMVPLRFIGESLFCTVTYDSQTKTATFTRGHSIVKITMGSKTAVVNGKSVTLDPPPMIKGGRTFVPVKFIADAFEAVTSWNAQYKEVTISYP